MSSLTCHLHKLYLPSKCGFGSEEVTSPMATPQFCIENYWQHLGSCTSLQVTQLLSSVVAGHHIPLFSFTCSPAYLTICLIVEGVFNHSQQGGWLEFMSGRGMITAQE